jgi:hypothetical protein
VRAYVVEHLGQDTGTAGRAANAQVAVYQVDATDAGHAIIHRNLYLLLRCVPARAWQCISAGRGAKGHRHYDWAYLLLDGGEQRHRQGLVARSVGDARHRLRWSLRRRRHQARARICHYRRQADGP